MESLILDLRQGIRSMLSQPTFAGIAALSLALGIGATTAVFTLVDNMLLRPIPGVSGPDRIVELGRTDRGAGFSNWSYPDLVDVAGEVGALEHVAAFETGPVNLTDDEGGERFLAMYASSGYFDVMGVRLSIGRAFEPEHDQGPGEHPLAVLSHALWQTRFNGDRDVIGATVRINRLPHTVIGVASPEFRGHEFGVQPAIWLPLTQYRSAHSDPARLFGSRNTIWTSAVGRMRPGVSVEEVDAELAVLFDRLAESYPESNNGRGARALPAGRTQAEARTGLMVAFTAIGSLMLLVLATTCANVGGMLLARAQARERELAVRLALGSGRSRLVRHLVTESFLIFLAGGVIGVFATTAGLRWLDPNRLLPTPFPVSLDLSLDWRLLGFGLLLTSATGVLFGVLPALNATRGDLVSSLRDQGSAGDLREGRLRRIFVGGQVAVALLLLSSTGLLVRSVQRGAEVDSGFDPRGVFVTRLDLTLEGYRTPSEGTEFLGRVLDRLRSMPSVASATAGTDLPLDGSSSSTSVLPEGRIEEPEAWVQSYYARVADDYFETLGIDLLRGRFITADDGPTDPKVALVNERFVERAWPGEDVLGRQIRFGLDPQWYTIVGVVADTKTDLITDAPSPQIYSAIAQEYGSAVHVAVRAHAASPAFAATVREAIRAVDPALAPSPTRSLESLAGLGMLPHRIAASVAGTLGALALFLAALGVYGIVAYMVVRRTREIGVRMALGASRSAIQLMVMRGAMGLALPGAVLGVALGIGIGFAIRSVLLEVSPVDPAALGTVVGLLLAVVIAATFAPARRASTIEPVEALRSE